jgi:UDP-GlcNAc:undecaprenyl-phosphate GlcNAc-1-phosphate transferase
MQLGTDLILLSTVSAATCAALVPFVRRAAVGLGAIDRPDARRVHDRPTPRMGGVAIFGAFVATLGLAAALGETIEGASRWNPRGALAFAMGATIVFAAGVLDDIRGLRPRTKLFLEFLAASLIAWLGGARVSGISAPGGEVALGALAAPVTVLWIVTITNAVNLIDGIDGLATGLSAIALGTVLVLAFPEHESVAILAAILVGACAGFLFYNFHPATIFLGDSGSLFLGFALGVLSTYGKAKSATGALTVATLLIVGLPLGDTLWAIARRYLRGLEPGSARSHREALGRIFEPDRNHIHHRLMRAGLGQRGATYALYAVEAAGCAVAIYLALVWRR